MTIDERVRDALHDADAHMPAAVLDNLGRQLARDFDALAEPAADPRRARGARTRVFIACSVAAVIAAALVGLFTLTRGRSAAPNVDVQPGTSTTATRPAGQVAAEALARQLLDRAVLPPGASVSTAPPPSVLSLLPPHPGARTLVDLHGLWTVPMSAHEAASFAQAHVTPGLRNFGVGLGSFSIRGVTALEVEEELISTTDDTIDSAELFYSASATGPATSALRVDAFVVWGPHHPHIPTRDKVVTVTGTLQYPSGKSTTAVVTDARTVAQLVTAFEKARIVLDSVLSCPLVELRPSLVTMSFATSRSAQPDVVAKVEDTGCRIADVRIDGHDAPAIYGGGLIDLARTILQR
jgi:hypothetical protein